ncbi:hypothetical protein HBB16_15780 [Pseudonocardia sp. MCCB 268]|nr:hypothetical protein [Pseudonocardia cytotoxica]
MLSTVDLVRSDLDVPAGWHPVLVRPGRAAALGQLLAAVPHSASTELLGEAADPPRRPGKVIRQCGADRRPRPRAADQSTTSLRPSGCRCGSS